MAIVPNTGTKYLQEDQLTPNQLKEIENKQSFDERLLKHDYIADTFNTRTAMNLSRMSPIITALGKLGAGAPIKTTYFSQVVNQTHKRSNASDYSAILNDVHKAYSKIENLEIRLNEPLTFNNNPDDNESEVEGVGKVFPGMTCNIGDPFLYEVSPGQIGIFVVSDAVPLSLHRGSFFEISFYLKEWASQELIDKFNTCTCDVYYYATQNVFGETRVLLKKEDYFNYLALLNLRIELVQVFDKLYHSRDDDTFLRPDGAYDPYMVQFVNKILRFEDNVHYPYRQMTESNVYEEECILTLLLDGKTRFHFTIPQRCNVILHTLGTMSVNQNNLVGKLYVRLHALGGLNYMGMSDAFVTRDRPNITDPFELILLNYLETKKVNSATILAYADTLGSVPDLMRFYAIPILIFLCNQGIASMGG